MGSILLASVLSLGVLGIAGAARDGATGGEYDPNRVLDERSELFGQQGDGYLTMVFHRGVPMDPAHLQECGACHVAHPSNLLPSESREAIMTGPDEHFDENAQLSGDAAAQITGFLDRGAPDRSEAGHGDAPKGRFDEDTSAIAGSGRRDG